MNASTIPAVVVFGKKNCPNCEEFKDFLSESKVPFRDQSVEYHTEYHDGWREDESVDVVAAYHLIEDLPVVKVGNQYLTSDAARDTIQKAMVIQEPTVKWSHN